MITLARDMRKATNPSSDVMITAMPETTLRGKLAQGCGYAKEEDTKHVEDWILGLGYSKEFMDGIKESLWGV